jgi:hypothetical protein
MWASHRKALILAIIAAVIIAIAAVTTVAIVYETPSCADTTQNQGEEGVDCGGPCSLLCTASQRAPSVRFVRQLTPKAGRTDVIAYVDNPNAGASMQDARYKITLYGSDNIVIATKEGAIDLLPKSTVPVFVPDFYSGFRTVARAFLTFDEASFAWQRDTEERPNLSVTDIFLSEEGMPRLTANVYNPTARSLYRVPVVATIFDSKNNAVAASATVVQEIPPMNSAPVIFTWSQPFPQPAARSEIIPIVPL